MRKIVMASALMSLMLGVALAQDFDPSMFKLLQPAMRALQRTPAALLANKGVQDELKMDDEQRKIVNEKAKERMAGGKERMAEMFGKFAGLKDVPEDQREAKMMELLKPELDKASEEAAKILKPEQMTRLKQIGLQMSGNAAYTDPDVAKELGLKDEQISKIKTINTDLGKDVAELMRAEGGGGGKGGFGGGARLSPEAREKLTNLNKEATEKIGDVLTAEQKSKWAKMTGDKFEMKFDFRPMKKKDD
jgi:hypothetical protein